MKRFIIIWFTVLFVILSIGFLIVVLVNLIIMYPITILFFVILLVVTYISAVIWDSTK